MEHARKCLECGLPIPETDLGTCPNCLFRLAFLPPADAPDDSSPPSHFPTPHPRYFAGYELLSEIAVGGMGVVWKARQLGVNRLVALKMIPAGQLASPQMRLRFRIEIETVVQLDHPNIVPLYETGEHDGQHYFSMKLLEGGNLGDWIARRHKSPGAHLPNTRKQLHESVHTLITISRAVHHAHQRGILHRDLKPSNILLDHQGTPHVADFGLAKVLGRNSGVTLTESTLGSPNYMSPEQAAGGPTQLSVATDVYGLGAILYELLTGSPPFRGATAVDTIRQVVDHEPASPRQLNPGIDADLETICLKCLQKNPALRYQSAEALASDLERWLHGQPILARPVGVLDQLARWCRRQPALAAALAASFLLLLLIALGTALAAVRIARAEQTASNHLRQSLLGQSRILRSESDMGRREEGLQLIRAAAPLGGEPEFRLQLRNELLSYLTRTEIAFVPHPWLQKSPDPALNLLSPQGHHFATLSNPHTLLILNAADGSPLQQLHLTNTPRTLDSFSHDARFLAVRSEHGLTIWDTQTAQPCFYTNYPDLVFAFAPNLPQLILQSGRKQADFLDLPSGRLLRRLPPYPGADSRTQWASLVPSPDALRLAAIRRGSRLVEVIDLRTGRLWRNLTNDGRALTVAWSPDSRRLAVSTTARKVILWDTHTTTRLYTSQNLPAAPHSLALNHDASLIASASDDRLIRFFKPSSPKPVAEFPAESTHLRFHPSGNDLLPVLRNGVPGSLRIQPPQGFLETLVADGDPLPSDCSFSANGLVIAAGTATNVVLCHASSGAILTNVIWSIHSMCFHPTQPLVMAAGPPGMYQWNLQPQPSGPSASSPRFALAHEQRIFPEPGWRSFTFTPAGDWFAAANVHSNSAFIFDRSLHRPIRQSGSHPGLQFVTLSPDARWLVTGSEFDRQLRLWDTLLQHQTLTIPGGLRPRAAFSPDGKYFAAFGVGFELREVNSWRLVPLFRNEPPGREPVLGSGSFSPDGRFLAVVSDARAIHLIDLATLNTTAILRPPGVNEIHALAFSPDNSRLAAVGDALRLRVWNLNSLNRQLSDFGLHWQPLQTPAAP